MGAGYRFFPLFMSQTFEAVVEAFRRVFAIALREWTVGLGFPSAAYALGVLLMWTQGWFYTGAIVAWVAAIFLCVDWWIMSRNQPLAARIAGCALGFAAIGFIGWVCFRPIPLEIMIAPPVGNYVKGTIIDGITWDDSYSPVGMMMTNETDFDYSDFEAHIKTNGVIKTIGFGDSINHCAAKFEIPGQKILAGGISHIDQNGKLVTVPLFSGPDVMANMYEIQCEKIVARSNITAIVAEIKDPTDQSADFEGATWAVVYVRYFVGGRKISHFESHCFKGTCGGDMPTSPKEMSGLDDW